MKSRIAVIQRIAAGGLLVQMGLSWPLWHALGRKFPMIPLVGEVHLPERDIAGDQGILAMVAVAGVLILPGKIRLLVVLLISFGFLIALDLNRLQPWVFFYGLVFMAILRGSNLRGYLSEGVASAGRPEIETIGILRLILAAVYLWSGLNKLTPYFAEDNTAWLIEAFGGQEATGLSAMAGYGGAVLEAALGPGLLFGPSRRFFRWLATGFHVVVIAGLLILQWNWVVIPWNLAMAALVWVLFRDREPTVWNGRIPTIFLVILAAVMPAFNIIHAWPEALSWKMYSNTQPEMTIYSDNGSTCPPLFTVWKSHAFDKGTKLTLDDWSLVETTVPPLASEPVFRRLGRYICRCAAQPDSAGIYILTVNRWDREAERLEKIPCSALMRKSR